MKKIFRIALSIVLSVLIILTSTSVETFAATEKTPEEIYSACAKAVVEVCSYDAYGHKYVATGFYVSKTQVLTVDHVFEKGLRMKVFDRNGKELTPLRFNHVDKENDLLLIKMKESNSNYLKFSTSKVKPGATVYCIGNPAGLLGTFSNGIVSAVNREVKGKSYIQASIPTGSGLGGAPLINSAGKAIGMIGMSVTAVDCATFAIKADVCKNFVDNISVDTRVSIEQYFQDAVGTNLYRLSNEINLASDKSDKSNSGIVYNSMEELTSEEIAEIAYSGTVDVRVTRNGREGFGSGFFLENDTIVTNRHVVIDCNLEDIRVIDYDGHEYSVVKCDYQQDGPDMAVLKIVNAEDKTAPEHKTLKINKEYIPKVGETLYNCGSPSKYSKTFAKGIASMCSRKIGGYDYIHATTPITGGSSGGPMLNKYGEVIGLMTISFEAIDMCNFAIMIKYIDDVSVK